MIIKVLMALVLLIVIFLTFRLLFGADAPVSSAAPTLDTAQLEKTLQKILDAQAKAPVLAVPVQGPTSTGDEALISAGASSAGTMAELEKLKKDLLEKEKVLIQFRQEAAKAAAAAKAAPATVAPESAAKFETKIKDLEARLAEYEIISEDIADLSFYKEENIRLQNELTSQKSGGGTSLAAPDSSSASLTVAPTPTDAGTVRTMGSAGSTGVPNLTAEPKAIVGVSPADDDLMKEFEKAIQDQKVTEAKPKEDTSDSVENSQLMNQFENFVKKS